MEEKDYKFGIIKSDISMNQRAIGICSCGQHMIGNTKYQSRFQCEKCGNAFFVDARNQHNDRFVIPYLEAERKDSRGFKIKRTNLSVVYSDGFVKPVKENLVRKMEYDIVDEKLKIWRNDEIEYDNDVSGNSSYALNDAKRRFFTKLEEDVFLNFISSDVTRDMYEVARLLGEGGWSQKNNILKGLVALMRDYKWMQILATAGIPRVDRFYRRNSYRGDKVIDPSKTTPHEILKVPKFMISHIRQDVSIDRYVLQQFQNHFNNIDMNKIRGVMDIVKDESTMRELANSVERLMSIHIDYDYTNLKKLVLYLFREVRLMQGINSPNEASTLLSDYIRMSRKLGLDWEKYPKSLKKEHDIVSMNYNMITSNNKLQDEFKLSIEKKSYQNLAFKDKNEKFAIILPETSESLVKEGNQLSHCVASYIKDVNSDRCKIVFLRDKDEITKPLVTIEVRGVNIRQARGFANRTVTPEQKDFISKWADSKNLVEAYY